MYVEFKHGLLRRTFFPIFDLGTLLTLLLLILVTTIIGYFTSYELALYMAVFGYIAICLQSAFLGLAPAKMRAPARLLPIIRETLGFADKMEKIDDNLWVHKHYSSKLWDSGHIRICNLDADQIAVTGRYRDLQILERAAQ